MITNQQHNCQCKNGMAGFWEDITGAGRELIGTGIDLAGKRLDNELFELKATLGTITLLAAIAAIASSVALVKVWK